MEHLRRERLDRAVADLKLELVAKDKRSVAAPTRRKRERGRRVRVRVRNTLTRTRRVRDRIVRQGRGQDFKDAARRRRAGGKGGRARVDVRDKTRERNLKPALSHDVTDARDLHGAKLLSSERNVFRFENFADGLGNFLKRTAIKRDAITRIRGRIERRFRGAANVQHTCRSRGLRHAAV